MSVALANYERQEFTPTRSVFRRMIDKVTAHGISPTRAAAVAHHSVRTGVQYGTTALTAGLLGAASAELAQGLEPHKVPLDGAVAVGGAVLGLFLDGELACGARDMGAAGLSIFTFRKVEKMLRAKKSGVSGDFAGEATVGSDRIVDLARNL